MQTCAHNRLQVAALAWKRYRQWDSAGRKLRAIFAPLRNRITTLHSWYYHINCKSVLCAQWRRCLPFSSEQRLKEEYKAPIYQTLISCSNKTRYFKTQIFSRYGRIERPVQWFFEKIKNKKENTKPDETAANNTTKVTFYSIYDIKADIVFEWSDVQFSFWATLKATGDFQRCQNSGSVSVSGWLHG